MARTQDGGIRCDSGRLAGFTWGKYGTRYQGKRFYDDGSGPAWIYQDAGGLLAIVRADSWETAWSVIEDEILDDLSAEDYAEYVAEIKAEHPELSEQEIFDRGLDMPEGCGYRSSGNGDKPWNQTGIYQQDLNGNRLELLTAEQMNDHGIVLQWEEWDHTADEGGIE